ncbi:MAG: lipoate--protein ligase [Lachnospiraceae bacterium]|nr:lipoate--protein ligase [Lachnospiraceae bacterium]
MTEGYVINSTSVNPYDNLALEEYLLDFCKVNKKPILYLWQNADTVVVGKNQNVYAECNMGYMKEKGIIPSRRMTGGGAVYHDLGNVNYTIITTRDSFDIGKNTEIIVLALEKCGVKAFKNGRNDICTSKGKISGNAYYSDDSVGLQHGTILWNVDTETMGHTLIVSQNKLSSKGVKSVQARVSDVVSENDNVQISDIKNAITESFLENFNIGQYDDHIDVDASFLKELRDKYSSEEWIGGKNRDYSYSRKNRFAWGEAEIILLLSGRIITEMDIYTDCIDLKFVELVKSRMRFMVDSPAQAGSGCELNEKDDYYEWMVEFENFLKQIFLELDVDFVE